MTQLRQKSKVDIWKKNQTCKRVYEAFYYLNANKSNKKSVKEIFSFFKEQAKIENEELEKIADEKYENEGISSREREDYIFRHKKKPISQKTIERCINEDPRIEGEGSKYFISDKKRFEYEFMEYEFGSRYFDPSEFGLTIYKTILGRIPKIPMNKRSKLYYERELNDFVIKIGCFVIFAMIEAVKPFQYKKLSTGEEISLREREDLVYYWLNNIIPLSVIFTDFRLKFDKPKQSHDWKTPISEIEEPIINKLINSMKKRFPDIYDRYELGKKQITGKNLRDPNNMDGDYDKIGKQIKSINTTVSERNINYIASFDDGDKREFTESKIFRFVGKYPRWLHYAKQNKINITIRKKRKPF